MEEKHEDIKYVCKDNNNNDPESIKVNNGFCVPTLEPYGVTQNDCVESCNIMSYDMLPDVVQDNTINGISDVFSYIFYGNKRKKATHIYHIKYPIFTEDLTDFIEFCNNKNRVLMSIAIRQFKAQGTFIDVFAAAFTEVTGQNIPDIEIHKIMNSIVHINMVEEQDDEDVYFGYDVVNKIHTNYIDNGYYEFTNVNGMYVEYNHISIAMIRKYIYINTPGHVIACVYEPRTRQIIVFETDTHNPFSLTNVYKKLFNDVFNLDVEVIMFNFANMQGQTELCATYTMSILTLAMLNPTADIYLLISMFANNESAKYKLLALNLYNIWLKYKNKHIKLSKKHKILPDNRILEITVNKFVNFSDDYQCALKTLNIVSIFGDYTKDTFRTNKKTLYTLLG